MKIRRPCYDKWWRCPGWAGPGWRAPRRGDSCPSGSLAGVVDWRSRWKLWRPHRCPCCGIFVLPSHVRYLDYTYLSWRVKRLLENWAWDRKIRREGYGRDDA